jgi:hypothetical protein
MFDRTNAPLLLTNMIRYQKDGHKFEDDPFPDVDVISKFLPLMGSNHNKHENLLTLEGKYSITLNGAQESPLICSDYGIVGSGSLSDHGVNHWHGQSKRDYEYPSNIGRGGLFRQYRRWTMENIGINPDTPIQREPYLIVVSINSTTKKSRASKNLDTEAEVMQKFFGNRVDVQSVELKTLSLVDQIQLVSKAAVFVTICGGGTVTSTFLPKGASIILYYSSKKLDFAFWNNFPQIKPHWLPLNHQQEAMPNLIQIIRSELDYLDSNVGL